MHTHPIPILKTAPMLTGHRDLAQRAWEGSKGQQESSHTEVVKGARKAVKNHKGVEST